MNDVFSSKLSPGTAGCPPAAHPALCRHPPDPCWWRPAPPAGLCTPGGRGQIRVCSRCAPFRSRCEEIHWVVKQTKKKSQLLKRHFRLAGTGSLTSSSSASAVELNYFLPVEVVVIQLVTGRVVVVVVTSLLGSPRRARDVWVCAVESPITQRYALFRWRPVGQRTVTAYY